MTEIQIQRQERTNPKVYIMPDQSYRVGCPNAGVWLQTKSLDEANNIFDLFNQMKVSEVIAIYRRQM